MKVYFLIIILLQIFLSLSDYSYELIEELVTKYIIFEIQDFNAFKIFKYIPPCSKSASNTKDIYAKFFLWTGNFNFYIYDNFDDIKQEETGNFANSKEFKNLDFNPSYQMDSELISGLTCGKEYYFVISMALTNNNILSSYILFNIIDASVDKINISPLISDRFIFLDTKPQEIFTYCHNETKYASIYIGSHSELKIFKNEEMIFNKDKNADFNIAPIEFEKNQNYTIYFEAIELLLISIQLSNDPKFFKIDNTNAIMPIFSKDNYYEVDISQYKLNDVILLRLYSIMFLKFKYQYKSIFNGKNFIELSIIQADNFMSIKKLKEDSSLIISVEISLSFGHLFSLLKIIKDVEEIKSDFSKDIVGPKYYFLDYFEFNNINSIGIKASESFFLYEQEKDYMTQTTLSYQSKYIAKTDNCRQLSFRNAIIFFNSTGEIKFEIKKYDYPIFFKNSYYSHNEEFFQMCQGENPTNELYFYLEDKSLFSERQLFLPVFGSFQGYYIKEEDAQQLSDIDFDKIKEPNFNQIYDRGGFLKIKCEKPLMLKHFVLRFDEISELNSDRKYYFNSDYLKRKYLTFNDSLLNNNLEFKITIYGLESQESINFLFNNNVYIYTLNNNSQEFNYTYLNYISNLMLFESSNEFDKSLIIEITVGYLSKNIDQMRRIINFQDSIGSISLSNKEGILIKVPDNLPKDLYDFSIIYQGSRVSKSINYFIDISYDKPEFLVKYNYDISPLTPLFKVNPYDYINKNILNSNDRFFYIVIFNADANNQTIYIKKPKLYSDAKLNKINILNQLDGNNKKYYYQIKIPETVNNNYLSIQTLNEGNFATKMAFLKNGIEYPFLKINNYAHHFNFPYDKRDKDSSKYINFYDVEENPDYINFIEINEHIYTQYLIHEGKNMAVNQLDGKNKLRIKLESISYMFYPNPIKYYLITNVMNEKDIIFALISGLKKPDKNKHQLMKVLEDDGLNEIFEKEFTVDIDLIEENSILCVPVNAKTNMIENYYISSGNFNYTNVPLPEKNKNNNKTLIFVIIIVAVAIILLILIFICIKCICWKKSSEDFEQKVLDEKLGGVE